MTIANVPSRLTRVVIDHDAGVEIAQLQILTQRIQEMLPHVSRTERDYIATALLNLAVSALVRRDTPCRY